MKLLYKGIGFSLLLAALASCTVSTDEHGHADEVGGDHGHDHGNTVEINSGQREIMGIKLGNPEVMSLSSSVQASGQLEVPPNHRATVGSVVEGRISTIKVLQGEKVRRGQVLALIEDPAIIEVQEQYNVASSELMKSEIQFKRDEMLWKDSAISYDEYITSRAEYSADKAVFQGFRTKLALLNLSEERVKNGDFSSSIPILSPIDGYIHLILTKNGSYIMANDPLFDIINNEHIHIDLSVFEKDIHKVKEGNSVVFSLVDQRETAYKGRIFAVGRTFEEDPRILTVHAEIDNKDGNLLPGMYVKARILTDSSRGLCVPNDAIAEQNGEYFIFVQDENNEDLFRRIKIAKGVSDIGFTQIRLAEGPLSKEDRVVLTGAYFLLADMGKEEMEHSH